MKKAFSMIELVFIIVIIGIISAIAIPKLSMTRSDAQYIVVQSDIQTILSAIQTASFAQDLNTSKLNGELIMEIAGLNLVRWIAVSNGVRLAKDGKIDGANNCVIIDFKNGGLEFSIDTSIETSSLCQKLTKIYGSKTLTLPLDNSSIKI